MTLLPADESSSSFDDPTLHTPGAPIESRTEPRLGQGELVGRYVILHELGAGGMGVVYAAYDPDLDRKVALKLLRVADNHSSGPAHADARVRLLREAQALAKLAHPNVVAVHDTGEHHGAVYLAMEYVDGQTLGAWLGRGPQPWARVLPVFVDAAAGLAAAHAKGLVHRDFKPDNVMVGSDGRVRVMDFGLARPELDSIHDHSAPTARPHGDDTTMSGTSKRPLDTDLTREGSIVGTPGYMAPEQFRAAATDARTDQFAFCVALWEALCGERPFTASTFAALANNVVHGKRRPIPNKVAVPSWLVRTLERGLAPEPDDRFASMFDLLAALDRGQRGRRRTTVVAAVGAGLLVVVGVGALRQLERQRAITACEARARELDAIWNDEARAQLRARYASTDPGIADRTLPWLDRWAEEWSTTRERTCVAATVEGGVEPELAERADACLAAHRDEFAALVDQFAQLDVAASIFQTTSAAAALPSAARCSDRGYLARRTQWPDRSNESARALAQLLAQANAASAAGEFDRELALATEARERAASLDDPLLAIDANLAWASALSHAGTYPEAEAALVDAFTAAGLAGDDDRATRAVLKLVWVVGEQQARFGEALVWAHTGQLLLARTEPDGGPDTAVLDAHLGQIRSSQGQTDLAIALLERSVASIRQVHGDTHPEIAALLGNIAVVLIEAGRLDEARVYGDQALAMTEATLGGEHPAVASILNTLANLEHLAGAHEAAIAKFERALAIDRRVYGDRHAAVATTLNNLATLRYSAGDLDAALAGLAEAAAIREAVLEPNHPDYAVTFSNLGYMLLHSGRASEAKPHYERALASYEASLGPDHRDLAPALLGLAEIALLDGRDAEAILHARRGIAIREAIDFPAARLAPARYILARALWRAPSEDGGDRVAAKAEVEQALVDLGQDDPLRPTLLTWLEKPN